MVEPITASYGLGIVEEFRLARSLTDRPLKATVPGLYTLLVPLKLGGAYRDKDSLLADLVAIVNAECRARWSPPAPTSSRSTSRTTVCTRAACTT